MILRYLTPTRAVGYLLCYLCVTTGTIYDSRGQSPVYLRKKSEIVAEKGVDQLGVLSADTKGLWLMKTTNGKPSRIRSGYFGGYPSIPTRTTLTRNGQKLTLHENENVVGTVAGHLLTREDRLGTDKYVSALRVYDLSQNNPNVKSSLVLGGIEYNIQPVGGGSDKLYVSDEFEGFGSEIRFYDKNLHLRKTIQPFQEGYLSTDVFSFQKKIVIISEPISKQNKIIVQIYSEDTLSLDNEFFLPTASSLSFAEVVDSLLFIQTYTKSEHKSLFQGYIATINGTIKAIEKGVVLNSPILIRNQASGNCLVGLWRDDILAVSIKDGQVIWQEQASISATSKNNKFSTFSLHKNDDNTITLLGGSATTSSKEQYDSRFVHYNADGRKLDSTSIGRLDRSFNIINTGKTITIVEPTKSVTYEKNIRR